ncbi:MAG: undecaprenyl/decaprenyl-phosphate alpha-N-acetylglucosaminyl 1-phosphate transferase [bacterium]|nr:undecaprenyl/decaprenyl-phosphate alpha-N-acetylglucosaminyl 1-phosphate transferase [bacterium]
MIDMIFVGFGSLVVAMGVTWGVTPALIRLAERWGAVDIPGGRKTHARPMPRIGGLAVFLGFVGGLLFAGWATGSMALVPQFTAYARGLALAAAAMLLVGLYDDVRGLSFKWKLAAQILASGYVWFAGFRIEAVTHPLGGTLDLGLLSFPLTVLWIVGITNAVNLIDGLDGLAAGVALIITGSVAVLAGSSGQLGVTAVSVTLAGSLLGFLRFNFNPARIFLGDSGSLFLGFVLAVTSIRGSQKGPVAVAILAPLLVLGLPLLDTGLAVARRSFRLVSDGMRSDNAARYMLANMRQVFLPDRGHIHHRLIDLGMSHRSAVLVLYATALTFALAAFALVLVKSIALAALLVAVLALGGGAFFLLVLLHERAKADAAARDATSADTPEAASIEGLAPPSTQPSAR